MLGLTQKNAEGETIKPFSGTDPEELFNVYIETTHDKWQQLDDDEKKEYSKKALENKDNVDITNGFFEFMRSRYWLNMGNDDF